MSSGLSCDGYKREIYCNVALVQYSPYDESKDEIQNEKRNARDEEEKHTHETNRICPAERGKSSLYCLHILRRRRRRRLALLCSIFGQRKSVYRKLFGYQIGTHGFRARRRMCNETKNDSYSF